MDSAMGAIHSNPNQNEITVLYRLVVPGSPLNIDYYIVNVDYHIVIDVSTSNLREFDS